jgi:hypothetical protein
MKYRIAGIDVHKRMLAVVIADIAVDGEFQFERRKVGTSPSELCRLADWLAAEQVEEVVMESTAQYWRPVWAALEQRWRPQRLQEGAGARSGQLHLAQAQSNRRAAGRKKDIPDAERLVKRLAAQELRLMFRAGCRAAVMADDNEAQASINAQSGAVSEPPGVFVGGGAH